MNRRVRGGAAAGLLVAVAALGGSCTDVATGPATAVALEFDTLPFPAVVTGDTLRDSLGLAAPLHAVAYNASGAVITDAGIRYIALDTGLTIDGAGIVTAQARNGAVRIVASVGALQSVSRTLEVARRPDTVIVTGKLVDTLRFTIPDSAARNVTASLGVRVATNDTAGGIIGSKGWLVSYQAFYHGAPLASADTTLASLWAEGSKTSPLDTTTADGAAGRTLRIRSLLLPTTPDSFVVLATVRHRGAAVRGSPVRFVIHTRPR